MITDTLANAGRYADLHPDFADAVKLLQTLDFANLPSGETPTGNPNIRLFVSDNAMRSKETAQPEAHQTHIDIQVPISGTETFGWAERGRLKNGLGYDDKHDIEFFDDTAETWIDVTPQEFVIFFPNDGHAPLVGTAPNMRKAVFKIRTQETRIE
ncbi:YhcH/YjgK/YiaL family protein [Neisseria perflava]|uniref:YhcH/YjgK/YiaL family protein n=1 Tax=Neisseria perflava TaxID=33053 RepID=UPI0020A11F2A|nr:YhcH/YjgK/YiaL family protein [Neisseria perflava]MCP1660417.1 YhcH/YjgK/YiaL family protein [Neisseria perflava]MCP1772099.1 YhcH/YjgK/YiaL family protein [Neisseria perflava]